MITSFAALADMFLRVGAITLCIILTVFIVRDAGREMSAKLGAFSAVTLACFLLHSIPGFEELVGMWSIPLQILCIFSAVAAWLFCVSLFDDTFRLSRTHITVVGVFCMLCFYQYVKYYQLFGYWPLMEYELVFAATREASYVSWLVSLIIYMMKVGMAVDMFRVAWSGRHEDLVEKRRRFRFIFVLMVVVVFAIMIVRESWIIQSHETLIHVAHFTQLAGTFALLLYLIWHMFSMDGEWVFGAQEDVAERNIAAVAPGPDRHDLLVLERLVQEGSLLEQGLTINTLALTAKMPEHRLRRLINQHLGFRNFSDYLNCHRVEAAKGRLSAIEERHIPILTVAMELGYNSLGPFNRAFKERLGMTPTEFRKKALADC